MGGSGLTPSEVVLRYLNALSSGDPDRVAVLVSADFENHHASELGDDCSGRDEYRRRLKTFFTTFERLRYEPEKVVAEGSRVFAAYRLTAVENGKPIDLHGVMDLTVADGQIARRVDYWDSLTYLGQVGKDPDAQ